MSAGLDESIATAAARMREFLDEQERGERSLAALLGDLKHVIHELPEGAAPYLREVTAALRAVGRVWSGSDSSAGTLGLEDEIELREALNELRKTVGRLG